MCAHRTDPGTIYKGPVLSGVVFDDVAAQLVTVPDVCVHLWKQHFNLTCTSFTNRNTTLGKYSLDACFDESNDILH